MNDFDALFERATGYRPYPYQRALAQGDNLPSILSIPTGLGKTAAITLAWLWRRRFAGAVKAEATPRRLIYCLPMRVLVEQTLQAVQAWLESLELHASGEAGDGIAVWSLLGGDIEQDWDRYPERDSILVGTQDLLLSRALGRGYAMSRFRWPQQFGLLNNDSLWVYDEVQLMGSGLATSTQLQAFRRVLGAERTASVWMSATIQSSWLETVDVELALDAPGSQRLTELDERASDVRRLVSAKKALKPASIEASKDGKAEAAAILQAHIAGSRSLVVVNTVDRALRVHEALSKASTVMGSSAPSLVLIHSRFRSAERERALEKLLSEPDEAGLITVSTQVVEAGVDVSARTLWTDIAPWPSLVQRFGRCNRKAEFSDATIYWFPQAFEKGERTGPYETCELVSAKARLEGQTSAAIADLAEVEKLSGSPEILRRRDLLDLFDTSLDLTGADIDVSRFIRDGDDSSVFICWREFDAETGPSPEEPRPARRELCPAPIGDVKERIKGRKHHSFWRWNHQDRIWERSKDVTPGVMLLAPCGQADYDEQRGWLRRPGKKRVVVATAERSRDEAIGDDPHSCARRWRTIAEHTDDVTDALEEVLSSLDGVVFASWAESLRRAARWHDRGKAHEVFQAALERDRPSQPSQALWGKSGAPMARYQRPRFRHELASALAMLQAEVGDLEAYLAAAHHGKVRLALRPHSGERIPEDHRSFVLGVWEGDVLPETDLGGGVIAPPVELSLGYAEMGEDPITGQSWVDRVLALRDDPEMGPFRLAYLEALLRAADWRGSDLSTLEDIPS